MTDRTASPREACLRLRSKGMFFEAEPDETVPGTSDGLPWCSLTMTALGPDGRPVEHQACTSGRSCYEGL